MSDGSRSTPEPSGDPAPPLSSLGLPLARPVAHLHAKSVALMVLTLLVAGAGFFYLLHARGLFEEKQALILTADNSEGISIGMDLTFSGFPVGSVQQIELADDGSVRIHVSVPQKNAHRLRDSSIFTLVRNVLGATSLRAYTSDWDDPPLPDNAVRAVLYGDASAEIPQLMASARTLLDNLGQLTSAQSDLAQSLGHLNRFGASLGGSESSDGLLKSILGNGEEARQVRRALANVNAVLGRIDRMTARADERVFGGKGLVADAQSATRQLDALLADTRQSLQKVDAILDDAKNISGNASSAATDLDALRAEVESSLRKVDQLLNQVNNTWPFARDREIRLP